jgi:TonB family protein
VLLRIGPEGEVLKIGVQTSSGYERLDRAAVEAYSRCKFIPAIRNGANIEASLTLQTNWRIDAKMNPLPGCIPDYPAQALRIEAQGTTTLQFVFDDEGVVRQVEVLKSSGHDLLDRAAMESLVKCRFRPAVQSGQKERRNTIKVEYVWRLSDEAPPRPAPATPADARDPYRPL